MLIPFGKITKTHGLSGELKLRTLSRRSDNITLLERIFIDRDSGDKAVEIRIDRARAHKDSAILKLEGIDSVEKALELVDKEVFVETSDLEDLGEDEYYWFELIGLQAYTGGGEHIGEVSDLIDGACQTILIIRKDDREVLIPMTEPFISEIDLEKSRIVISPIEGMIE